ncbi:hypothetical protein G8770_08395 [Aestuariicella hydrocarbonica]|uniref:Toxin CptA n=1 Tax=Pseudomaricurvus hydrocarbonicus TaxID=1470433 RepID=A0A9E5MH61_9GAMM|nr:hypothetical protein [Aestuariicella hydrocarbonica]NHO65556.1 hypothetical protein [Aestuariicella hydrocarbonica]
MARATHLLMSCLALAAGCLSALAGLGLLIWCLLVLLLAAWGYRYLARNPVGSWLIDARGLSMAQGAATQMRVDGESARCGFAGIQGRADADPLLAAGMGGRQTAKAVPRLRLEVVRGWQLAPWWLQLHYRAQGQRRWRSLLLWPDSASPEALRLLRSEDFSGPRVKPCPQVLPKVKRVEGDL